MNFPGRQGYGLFMTIVIGSGWAGSAFWGVGVDRFDWRSLILGIYGDFF